MKSARIVLAVMIGFTAAAHAAVCNNGLWASGCMSDPAARRAWATEQREKLTKLDAQIPTLSPSEERWLRNEYDDELARNGNRYTKRSAAAMNSREYDLRIAKTHLAAIYVELASIARIAGKDAADEAKHWVRLAALFADYEFGQSIKGLARRGIVNNRIDGTEAAFYFEDRVLNAQYILNYIVVPYFDGRIGGGAR